MTDAKIFLVGDESGKLTEMVETAYDTEAILQMLLVDYPSLIPGDQINPDNPLRWLLVQAEIGIPGGNEEGDRWALDHLFLDQNGIPSFVECKRATDTRIRREVVAQMLDYAANGTKYWTADRLRQAAAETAQIRNLSLDEAISELIEVEDESDIEAYWDRVEANLESGRVRLLFVADIIPKELRRLVEFMNEKMNDIEVLAIEVTQFLGGNQQKVLVPRVIGLTEAVRMNKSTNTPRKRQTNLTEFMSSCSPEAKGYFEYMLEAADQRGHVILWSSLGFSVRARLRDQDYVVSFAYGYPPDLFQFYFSNLPITEQERAELRAELLAEGVFKESGKQTLSATISSKTEAQLRKTYDLILDRMDTIKANH